MQHVKSRATTMCPFCQRRVRNGGYEQHLDLCRTADSVAEKCAKEVPKELKQAQEMDLKCTSCGEMFRNGYNPAEGVFECPSCFMKR